MLFYILPDSMQTDARPLEYRDVAHAENEALQVCRYRQCDVWIADRSRSRVAYLRYVGGERFRVEIEIYQPALYGI